MYIYRRIIRVSMFVRNLYEPLNYDIRKLNSLRHDENPWHDTRAMKHRHVLPWVCSLRWPASPPSNIRLSRWTGWWSSWEPEVQIPDSLILTSRPFFFNFTYNVIRTISFPSPKKRRVKFLNPQNKFLSPQNYNNQSENYWNSEF